MSGSGETTNLSSLLFHDHRSPSDRATARKGISSMCVDLLTGPLCPIFGLFHTTRGTPDLLITFPPHSIIRLLSSMDSGLWSLVRGSLRHISGLFGSCVPRTMAESPTCPMKILPRRMKAMEAVVPAVLGSPLGVFGQLGNSFHIARCVVLNPSLMAFNTDSSLSSQKESSFTILFIKFSFAKRAASLPPCPSNMPKKAYSKSCSSVVCWYATPISSSMYFLPPWCL